MRSCAHTTKSVVLHPSRGQSAADVDLIGHGEACVKLQFSFFKCLAGNGLRLGASCFLLSSWLMLAGFDDSCLQFSLPKVDLLFPSFLLHFLIGILL